MNIGLGIDAGGTYTDAVLVDFTSQSVLATAKALTTKDDYSRGVDAAIRRLPAEMLALVSLVSLSTTLATNAIVEGKGCKVGTLVIGFDDDAVARVGHTPIRVVPGTVDISGHEVTPFDEHAARKAILDLLENEHVGALAISGMVSAMNPVHELRARDIARSLTDVPVVCAHELSMQLDSIKRTITATLNARLLPIIADLIAHVKSVMSARGVHAPLMVVRGDGTLMSEALARYTPVETILSGPAASVCGAQFLSGVQQGLVIDIGGTTSDIALLIDGQPVVAARGARVGDWSTNVRAIDIKTVGLGGDSAITLTRDSRVLIGPRRAIPLSFLAYEYPEVMTELQRLWHEREKKSSLVQPVEFYQLVTLPDVQHLAESEASTLLSLADGPLSREQIAERTGAIDPSLVPVKGLESLGYIQRSTFTPTDILHFQGRFTAWNCDAAELALRLFAFRAGVEAEKLAEFALDTFSYWMTVHLMHRLIRHQMPVPEFPHGPADRALFDMIADGTNIHGLTLRAKFDNPLVAIGAPAWALAVEGAGKMGAHLIVPEHAEVANAVGAITGSLSIMAEATITPDEERYIVHTPVAMREFSSLEEAKTWSEAHVRELLEERVALAQMEDFPFHREVQCVDRTGLAVGGNLFLECRVRAQAVGKPQFAAFVE